ncbi:hypothetical protein DFQ29_000902, partial [Apophysomyces sp. BC1021]
MRKFLGYLLRILFRLHLAPKREQRFYGQKQKRREDFKNRKGELQKQQQKLSKKTIKPDIKREMRTIALILHKHKDNPQNEQLERKLSYPLERLYRNCLLSSDRKSILRIRPEEYGMESDNDDYESGSDNEIEASREDQDSEPDEKEGESTSLVSVAEPGTERTPKETTRARLNSLNAVAKRLIRSPDIDEEVKKEHVKKISHNKGLTEEEIIVMLKIVNTIRPFVPKTMQTEEGKAIPTPIASQVSFFILANTILRACGYKDFCMEIFPRIRPSEVHALPLDESILYELFCSSMAGKFTVLTQDRKTVTSVARARLETETMIGSFFNLVKIRKICKAHGLKFRDRITATDGAIAVLDELSKSVVELENEIKQLDATIKETQNTVQRERRKTKGFTDRIYSKKKEASLRSGADKWGDVRKLKRQRQQSQQIVNRLLALSSKSKSRKYILNMTIEKKKVKKDISEKKGKKKPKPTVPTVPTVERPQCEDNAEHIELNNLLNSSDTQIVFGGTDYGLITMSETVPLMLERLSFHVGLYNRFSSLVSLPDTTNEVPAEDKYSLETLKLPRS